MSADALLAAIRAEPEEDTPRLAYADLLEERGGEADRDRAEYIRASVELDRAKEEDPVLKARVKELWERYGAAWSAPLAGDGGLLDGPQRKGFLSFARGFIDRINLDGESLVRHGETIHRLAPVTRLSVSYLTDGQLAEVVRKPWLRSVRTLELAPRYDGQELPDWSRLADAPLRRLRYLSISEGTLGPAGAARLAACRMTALKELYVLETPLSTAAAARLFAGPSFRKVRTLGLLKCGLSTAGIEAIASSATLARVTDFEITYQKVRPAGVEAITRATFWPNLEILELSGCDIGDSGLRRLLAAAPTGKLNGLTLEQNGITGVGLSALARSPLLASLAALNLDQNQITDAGATALARSPHIGRLKYLYLKQNPITGAGRTAIWGSCLSDQTSDLRV